MTASTGTAFHAITLADIHAGDTVAVYGVGCLGTQALQLMKIMGATVFVVDIREGKLDAAKKLGADVVINASETDPVKKIRELTGGRGADAAFEIIGLPVTMLQAIDSVRPAGKIIDVGSVMEPIQLKMMPFIDEGLVLNKELTLMTISHCSGKDMVKLMDIVKALSHCRWMR
jgi:threonine dehydrogenase-like Zn-dependent dehydrogenase